MAMNERELQRNIGRIPRLIFHIKRCEGKDQAERVAGFQEELERRKAEMIAAGFEQVESSVTRRILAKAGMTHADLLQKLLAVNLSAVADDESKALDDLYLSIFPGEEILKPATIPTLTANQ